MHRPGTVTEHETALVATPRRRGRRVVIGVMIVVVVAALLVGYLVWAKPAEQKPAAAPAVSTAQVARGSVASETRVTGTVQYAMKEPIASGLTGVVTELPAPRSTLGIGAVAYRVDTAPVMLLVGAMPAWRDFAPDMSRGEDIRQLEQNLLAFGFFEGEPDDRFTWDTTAAIRAWQKSLGVERTGTVARSMILFTDQELRVDSVESRVGAQVGAGTTLYQATGLQQVVDLNVKSSERALAVAGAGVTVSLPAGGTTAGVVESVAAPVSKPAADGKESSIVVPVRIAVADQAALAGLALATVTVSFTSAAKNDVLTVPVDALVPISDTEFAVELPRTSGTKRTLVPVTVGAFAAGMVEISGEKIVDGLAVVVPAQ